MIENGCRARSAAVAGARCGAVEGAAERSRSRAWCSRWPTRPLGGCGSECSPTALCSGPGDRVRPGGRRGGPGRRGRARRRRSEDLGDVGHGALGADVRGGVEGTEPRWRAHRTGARRSRLVGPTAGDGAATGGPASNGSRPGATGIAPVPPLDPRHSHPLHAGRAPRITTAEVRTGRESERPAARGTRPSTTAALGRGTDRDRRAG